MKKENKDTIVSVNTRREFQQKLREVFIPSCIKDWGNVPFDLGDAFKNWTFFTIYEDGVYHTVEIIN